LSVNLAVRKVLLGKNGYAIKKKHNGGRKKE